MNSNVRPVPARRAFLSGLCGALALIASATGAASTATAAASSPGHRPALLVLGDSISAEYGLARDSGWVRLLDARLRDEHYDYDVVNASISGETTSGGRSRLAALLKQHRPTHARAIVRFLHHRRFAEAAPAVAGLPVTLGAGAALSTAARMMSSTPWG